MFQLDSLNKSFKKGTRYQNLLINVYYIFFRAGLDNTLLSSQDSLRLRKIAFAYQEKITNTVVLIHIDR